MLQSAPNSPPQHTISMDMRRVPDRPNEQWPAAPPPAAADGHAHGQQTLARTVPDNVDVISSDDRQWDVFRLLPPPGDPRGRRLWADITMQLLKVVTMFVLFVAVVLTGFIAKVSFLMMTSAIGWVGRNATVCTAAPAANEDLVELHKASVQLTGVHVAKWIWAAYIALCVPDLLCGLKCLYKIMFRNLRAPSFGHFFTVLIVECLSAFGVGMFVFALLPSLDAAAGAMLSSSLCLLPAVLTLLSRRPTKTAVFLVTLDLLAIAAQSSAFWAWPVFAPHAAGHTATAAVALSLISLGWWTNFAHNQSILPCIRRLAQLASDIGEHKSKTYVLVAPAKCIIYLAAMLAFLPAGVPRAQLFAPDVFSAHPIEVPVDWPGAFSMPTNLLREPPPGNGDTRPSTNRMPVHNAELDYDIGARMQRSAEQNDPRRHRVPPENLPSNLNGISAHPVDSEMATKAHDALWVLALHCISVVLCYQCGKFACKVMIQIFSFTLPIATMVPATIIGMVLLCGSDNGCLFNAPLPDASANPLRTGPTELNWRCYTSTTSLFTLVTSVQSWLWLAWFVSQFWVTIYLWRPRQDRLASADRLFAVPWFCGAFVDVSLALARRRDDKMDIKTEDIDFEDDEVYEAIGVTVSPLTVKGKTHPASLISQSTADRSANEMIRSAPGRADGITKIYACATMWHERPKEMMCMLKSLFRLDEDQCARRNAQKYLKVVDPDYYEFEAHIFMDDAYDVNDYGEPVLNKFVQQLLEKMNAAASAVHQTQMRLKPPRKMATPYGGRLVYILPGKNKLAIHLKDKNRIRHRKRWSQVMYLYFLLGYRIMAKIQEETRKETISENTYILTLDGDVDFTPSCVHLLVDLMKKNRKLGAACGRIHPRGSGLMVWYQKFEYAIGHWFQKAAEHMIGCVLCAPGCFSLFRCCALMDDNVTRRYAMKSENPVDYIQYDQGEDRWLCTLLLQRGYRVEYCAASDALTFAPEGFGEFFNQRRRWIPSTLANIIDLLVSYRTVVRINDNISVWYIAYQFVMLLSSILGPGTIFLMTVGAISISFDVGAYVAFVAVLLPMLAFALICLTCSTETQLGAAQMIGALFTLLMTSVIVGVSLQIKKDGLYSPNAIFLFSVIGSFITAALVHPMELACILPMPLYFIAVPCMYMILPVYSMCNLNVVSWGTRENPKIDSSDATGVQKKTYRHRGGRGAGHFDVGNGEIMDPDEMEGAYSVGCGPACKVLCCLQPAAQSPPLMRVAHHLERINEKLERIDRRWLGRGNSVLHDGAGAWQSGEQRGLLADDDDEQVSVDGHEHFEGQDRQHALAVSDTWLEHRLLRRATRAFYGVWDCPRDNLDPEEVTFWNELIDKYLTPLRLDKKDSERIKSGLKELRNKCAFLFFMMNGLFILIVFLLQMKKECLHIEWPFGPKVNRSIVPCDSIYTEEVWEVSGLQLEPIGLIFLIFFMSILAVQFVAMLLHRLGTLAHIIASTDFWMCGGGGGRTGHRLSEDELVVQNAVEIAKELQAIRGVDDDSQEGNDEDGQQPQHNPGTNAISRRRVVQNLESSRRRGDRHRTETLDAAFRKRFFALRDDAKEEGETTRAATPVLGAGSELVPVPDPGASGGWTRRPSTVRALKQRRDNIFGTLDASAAADMTDNFSGSDMDTMDERGVVHEQPRPAERARGPAQRRRDRILNQTDVHQAQHPNDRQQHAAPPAAGGSIGRTTTDDGGDDSLRERQTSSGHGRTATRPPLRTLLAQTAWASNDDHMDGHLLHSTSGADIGPANQEASSRF